ncbi:alpha/beta hydrolase [Mangrovicoccus algicola]|uniref:Alpha/beta hydrolase n=1 Tax=Mangrovicoccus algicola TaxID=2771008 RepID=A0A8J6YT42_9RHOB|nr:alpha/beta fold hydrolase [Mangrovicoccus algicola]MBE3638688.1 alpha/beta hydrolase [Mangrovicoccus algicola]
MPVRRVPAALAWRDPGVPGIEALEPWLAAREAAVPGLRPGAAKAVLWAGRRAERTALSLVYLHGFSAAAPELRPLPDLVAAALGANLHFARLAGHGSTGPAMAGAGLADWADNLAEAIAIGRRIGGKVIVMGSSMGGALATLAALDPAHGRDVAGLMLIAPAYRLRGAGARALTAPLASVWGRRLLRGTRTVPPRGPRHGAAWTLDYPMVSLLPLGALVGHVGRADFRRARIPAAFAFADADRIVDARAIRRAAAEWGAPARLLPRVMGPQDDIASHVIAGDILSPGQTAPLARDLACWARGL